MCWKAVERNGRVAQKSPSHPRNPRVKGTAVAVMAALRKGAIDASATIWSASHRREGKGGELGSVCLSGGFSLQTVYYSGLLCSLLCILCGLL